MAGLLAGSKVLRHRFVVLAWDGIFTACRIYRPRDLIGKTCGCRPKPGGKIEDLVNDGSKARYSLHS